MTIPRIEHATLSDHIQCCLEAKDAFMAIVQGPSEGPEDRLRPSAAVAVSAVTHLLTELRRIAGETGDQT